MAKAAKDTINNLVSAQIMVSDYTLVEKDQKSLFYDNSKDNFHPIAVLEMTRSLINYYYMYLFENNKIKSQSFDINVLLSDVDNIEFNLKSGFTKFGILNRFEILKLIKEHADVKILALCGYSNSGNVVVTKYNKNTNSINDIENKKIGYYNERGKIFS